MKNFDEWNEVKKKTDKKEKIIFFREREIVFISIGQNIGSEIYGKGDKFLRPVLVFKKFGKYNFLGIPLTSKEKKGEFYLEISFKNNTKKSTLLFNQIRVFDSKRIIYKIGKLSEKSFNKVIEKFNKITQPNGWECLMANNCNIIPKNRDINKYSKDYLNLSFERIQEKFRKKKIVKILNKYKAKKILEIGCGIDSISNYYKGEYLVIEPSKEFIKNLKVPFINDFFENVELNEEFDFILVSGLLHEVSDVDKFLLHLKKIAKNSIIHINVPNAKSFHKLLGVSSGFLNSIYEETPTHKILQQNSIFDMDRLVKLLEKYNFEIIEKGGYFIKPFSHSQMAKMLEYEIIDEKILEGLYNLKELEKFSSEIFVNIKVKDENN